MKLKSKKFTRPVVTPFEEEVDPVGLARTVAKEYRAMEDGHHARLRAFLGRAYQTYQLFLDFPDSFERLKQEPFWRSSRQKPKGLTTRRGCCCTSCERRRRTFAPGRRRMPRSSTASLAQESEPTASQDLPGARWGGGRVRALPRCRAWASDPSEGWAARLSRQERRQGSRRCRNGVTVREQFRHCERRLSTDTVP
jgi:hypothetical protein